MSNDLEKFISNNKEAFDDKVPAGKVWNNVEAALWGKKKNNTLPLLVKYCLGAAAMLIIGSMIYFKFFVKEGKTNTVAKTETTVIPGETEMNAFAKVIVLKQEELKLMTREQPELYRKFSSDIIQLDSSYKALKDQFTVTPNKEKLVEAMIQNLELQLSVLNQQLNIIKQIKQSKKYSHEKSFPAI